MCSVCHRILTAGAVFVLAIGTVAWAQDAATDSIEPTKSVIRSDADVFDPSQPIQTTPVGDPAAFEGPALPAPTGTPEGGLLVCNGPFTTGTANGCLGGNTSALAPPCNVFGFGHQVAANNRVADDFTVPSPGWDIATMTWYAYQTGAATTGTITAVNVRIWDGPPNAGGNIIAGDTTTNRMVSQTFSGTYRVTPTTLADCTRAVIAVTVNMSWVPVLGPGTYWVDVQCNGSLASGPWANPVEPDRPTDNALQSVAGVWGPLNDAGCSRVKDLPFCLNGVVATPQNGACCNDAIGDCTPNVPQTSCPATSRWVAGATCAQLSPPCGQVVGACCLPGGGCQDLTGDACVIAGGVWSSGSCATVVCPPANDACENAIVITDGTVAFSTLGSTTDGNTAGACVTAPALIQNDVWYTYTATCTGFLTVSTCPQTNYDSVLVVYDTGDCNAIRLGSNEIGCSDDDCGATGGPSELVDLFVVQGLKYTIRIAGWDGATGSGDLVVKCRTSDRGACCRVNGTCDENVTAAQCPAPNRFVAGRTCQTPTTCPPAGACCLGVQGCQLMFAEDCTAQGGAFLGVNSACPSTPPGNQDCDNNGIINACEIAQQLQTDCQPNGIPDNCDVNPALGGTSRDCQPDGTPDECQLVASPPIDNGPLVTHPGGGFGGADASALQTNLALTIYGYGHQFAVGYRVADDFTVTDPYKPTRVTFMAYQTNSGTTSSINTVVVQIWNGRPGDPGSTVVFGDLTTNRLTSTAFSNIYRPLITGLTVTARPLMRNVVDLTGAPTLQPGTYWLDWSTGGTLASGPWVPPVTILGQTGKPGANGRQFTTAWGDLVDPTPGGTPQDLPFIIEGAGGGDCNCNRVPDDCDISGGTSQDVNQNGRPDECERGLPTSAVGACCLPGGSCTDTILRCCNDLGGSFRGVGTACATTQCPVGCATVLGDMDGDGDVDGADMQRFVACVLAGPAIGAGCECADMDGSGTLTAADVPLFATRLRGP